MLERLLAIGSIPLLVLALLAAGLGIPIPEDPVLLAAGVLAHRRYPWWLVLPIVYGAVVSADCILYALARRVGEPLLSHWPFRVFATRARRLRVRWLFARHGSRVVFVGRHLAGLRAVVFILAGIERMPFGAFLLWDALAAVITVPAVFGLGYLFSAHVAEVQAGVARTEHWIAAILGLAAFIGWLVWSHGSHQGRLRD